MGRGRDRRKRDVEPFRLSRREFLGAAGAAGAGALLSVSGLSCSSAGSPRPNRALVIGSGFGGAVTALRLVQRGVEVTLLEKGRRWPITPEGDTFSPYFPPDGRSTWLRNLTVVPIGPPLPIDRYVGVLEGHFYPGMRVLTGACYGGGSVVYGGLLVKPPEHLFRQVFPQEIDYGEMETYYRRVARMLEIGTVPDDIYRTEFFTHYRVVEEQNDRAGLTTARIESASDWQIVRAEIDGSIRPAVIHGEAIYGVNSGAKRSLDMNYLAQAEATGLLKVHTLHRVTDIGTDGRGRYLVWAEQIDEAGRVLSAHSFSSDRLFLAAGSIGTSNLLVKAKAKGLLPLLNEEIGRGWGNNGNVEVLRVNVGARTGRWQGGPPATAIEDYDNPVAPLFVEHPQFPIGLECGCLLYFGIGLHFMRGHFTYDPRADRAVLSWPASGNGQQMVNQALLATMDRLNQANGGELSPLVGGRKRYMDDAAYHPLGGAVIGEACDAYGRVKNYPGLYVNDSALVPGSAACANPAFTVAALAERNIARILAEDF